MNGGGRVEDGCAVRRQRPRAGATSEDAADADPESYSQAGAQTCHRSLETTGKQNPKSFSVPNKSDVSQNDQRKKSSDAQECISVISTLWHRHQLKLSHFNNIFCKVNRISQTCRLFGT